MNGRLMRRVGWQFVIDREEEGCGVSDICDRHLNSSRCSAFDSHTTWDVPKF